MVFSERQQRPSGSDRFAALYSVWLKSRGVGEEGGNEPVGRVEVARGGGRGDVGGISSGHCWQCMCPLTAPEWGMLTGVWGEGERWETQREGGTDARGFNRIE